MNPGPGVADIERAVVISLKRRPHRLARFREEVESVHHWPMPVPQLFEAVDGEALMPEGAWYHGAGAWGCWRSHLLVLRQAVADGVASIAVFEDDAGFRPDFGDRFYEFVDHVPNQWDALLLGGQHMKPPLRVGPSVVRCTRTVRTHAYVLRGDLIRVLLNCFEWMDGTQHLDWVTARELGTWRTYAPHSFLVCQRAGFSDIAGWDVPERHWTTAPR